MKKYNIILILIFNFLLAIFLVGCRESVDLSLVLESFDMSSREVLVGESLDIYVDIDEDISRDLEYIWSSDGGAIQGEGSSVRYTAFQEEGLYDITLLLRDSKGQQLILNEEVEVIDFGLNIFGAEDIYRGQSRELEVIANVKDLEFEWEVDKGSLEGEGSKINYKAPKEEIIDRVKVLARDDSGREMGYEVNIEVKEEPIIIESNLKVQSSIIGKGQGQDFKIEAINTYGRELTYTWEAERGEIIGEGEKVSYISPTEEGEDTIEVRVSDGSGFEVSNSLSIDVIHIWERSFSATTNDSFEGAIETEDGYLAVGYSKGDNSYPKGYAIGIDRTGSELWSIFDSSKVEQSYFKGISSGNEGEYILVGARSNPGDHSKDGYVVRLDGSSGKELARYNYGGRNKEEEFYNVVSNSKGNNLIVGYSNGETSSAYLLEKGKDKGIILDFREYRYNGNDGGSNSYFTHLVERKDGYFLVGYSRSYGSEVGEGLLAHIDKRGRQIRTSTYASKDSDIRLQRIVDLKQGGYLLVGALESPESSTYKGYIIAVDREGREKFSQAYGISGKDSGFRGVSETADGGYLLAGYTNNTESGSYDGYLVKIDYLGELEWKRSYGSEADDEFMDILPTSDGGYLLIGYTQSLSNEERDGYLVKIDPLGNFN